MVNGLLGHWQSLAAGMRVRAPLQEYSWSRTSLGPARLSNEAVVAAVCESETGTNAKRVFRTIYHDAVAAIYDC